MKENSTLIFDRSIKSGIYQIYKDIFINNNFEINIAKFLDYISINNDSVYFNLYSIMNPKIKNHTINTDFNNIINYISKDSFESLDSDSFDLKINNFCDNTEFIIIYCHTEIVTDSSQYLGLGFQKITASSIKSEILKNIDLINNSIHYFYKINKENLIKKLDINSEVLLIISADYNHSFFNDD